MENFCPVEIPYLPEYSQSFEKIYETYQKTGEVDLSIFQPARDKVTLQEFQNRFPDCEQSFQTQFLEQLMLNDLCSEAEILLFTEMLPPQQQCILIEFIYTTLKDDAFAAVFQRYSHELSQKRLKHIVQNIQKHEPERILLILHCIPPQKTNFLINAPETYEVVDYYTEAGKFTDFDSAQRLLELFFLRTPKESPTIEKKEMKYWKKNLEFLVNEFPFFVFPYLNQFEERGIFTKEYIQNSIVEPFFKKTGIITHFFKPKEYAEQKEKLIQKYRQRMVARNKTAERDFEYDEKNLQKELSALSQKHEYELYEHIFRNYSAIKKYIDHEKLKEFCTQFFVPFGYILPWIDLEENEIEEICVERTGPGEELLGTSNIQELQSLLQYIQGKSKEKKIHTIIVMNLQKHLISNPNDSTLAQVFVENLEIILPYFPQNTQEKILQMFLVHAPTNILFNQKFFFSLQPEHHALFTRSLYQHPYQCTRHYLPIMMALGKIYGEKSTEKEYFKKFLQHHLQENPDESLSARGSYQKIFTFAFSTEEQQKEYFEKIFQNPKLDTYFLVILLNAIQSGNLLEHTSSIQSFLRQHPHHIRIMIGSVTTRWNDLKNIFSTEELVNLFFAKVTPEEEKNFDANERDSDFSFVFDILQSSLKQSFLEKIKNGYYTNVFSRCMKFNTSLTRVLSSDTQEEQTEKIQWQKLFEELNLIFVELLENKTLSAFEFLRYAHKQFPYLKEKITSLCSKNAHEYFSRSPYELRTYFHLLSKNDIETLFQKLPHKLSWLGFEPEDLGKYTLPDTIAATLRSINPFLSKKEKSFRDYYEFILSHIHHYKAFAWYGPKLQEIARRQFLKQGPRSGFYMNTQELDDQFVFLVRRITLLEHSPFIKEAHWAKLNALSEEKREQICSALEHISLYDLEFELPLHFISEDTTNLEQSAQKKLTEYFATVFEIPFSSEFTTENISSKIIQILSLYQKRTHANGKMKKSFQTFLSILLKENFTEWKWWGESNPTHKKDCLQKLKEQALVPEKLHLEQYETWCEEISFDHEKSFTYTERNLKSSVKTILQQAQIDNHIEPEEISLDLEKNLYDYQNIFLSVKNIHAQLKNLYEQYPELKSRKRKSADLSPEILSHYYALLQQKNTFIEEKKNVIENKLAWLCLSHFSHITFAEIQAQTLFLDGHRIQFSFLFGKDNRPGLFERVFSQTHPNFYADTEKIKVLCQEYVHTLQGNHSVSQSTLSLTDRFDLETTLNIGKVPVATCQHYNSKDSNNKGLLSYAMDPNVKIIQIYSPEKKLLARAVLRLLQDQHKNPVLFLERTYSVNAHPHFHDLTLNLAKKKATAMNVPLFSEQPHTDDDIADFDGETKIMSEASRTPFVYSDAGGGLCEEGSYVISTAMRIQT